MWRLCRPEPRRLYALAQANHQKTPFSIFKKKFGGGNLKKSKGFFWRGAARLAVLGGGAELRHFAGNRFELGCKTPPLTKD